MIDAPWFIDKIEFDAHEGKLNTWIDFASGSMFPFVDKELGVSGSFKAYDTKMKTWRHLSFFQYECLLHARMPGWT
jgi:hypothetical protein